jgi:hypothetical protein
MQRRPSTSLNIMSFSEILISNGWVMLAYCALIMPEL